MPRLLLVSTLPNWVTLATEAAGRLEAAIDVVPDVHTALVRMLRPDHVYTHVLASGPLRSREVDTLAGMLDEVTLRATPLVILGGGGGGGEPGGGGGGARRPAAPPAPPPPPPRRPPS